ncbi:MAG: OmpA family protein [Shewanella sp.]
MTTLGLIWKFKHESINAASTIPETTWDNIDSSSVILADDEKKEIHQEQKFNSLFTHNSSALSNTSSLNIVVDFLLKHPYSTIYIIGHTDSSGSEKYNQRLSELRANSVANYILSKGIEAHRLTVFGKGEMDPIADNMTANGRSINRRAEIIIPQFTATQADK